MPDPETQRSDEGTRCTEFCQCPKGTGPYPYSAVALFDRIPAVPTSGSQTPDRILIVEDDEANLDLLGEFLESEGYRVQNAMNLAAGLNRIEQEPPDLCLVDVNLPDGDGIELCRRLKSDESTRDISVILMSGTRIDEETRGAGLESEADDFLQKPISLRVLLARIRSSLRLRHAERLLREQKRFFETLLETLPVPVFIKNREGCYSGCNKAFEDFLGRPASEILGRTVHEIAPRDLADRYREMDEGLFAEGKTQVYEWKVMSAGGDERVVVFHKAPLRDSREEIIGLIGGIIDITEQVRAREELEAQKRFLESATEALAHPFYVVDAKTYQIVLANSAARAGRFSGALTCHAMSHGSDRPCGGGDHLCPLDEMRRTRKPVVVEHRHVDAEGHLHDVEVRAYPVLDASGELVRMIEYSFDITERKRTEARLSESEARYRALIESAPEAMVVADAKTGRIVDANARALSLFGYARRELLEIAFTDLAPPPERGETRRLFRDFIFMGEGRAETVRLVRRDGRTLPVSISARVLILEGSRRLLAIIHDRTEKEALHEALRHVMQSAAGVTETGYLDAVTSGMARALGADIALCGSFVGPVVQTLSLFVDGAQVPNIEYPLRGTPCEQAKQDGSCCFAHDVAALFPEDAVLAEMGIDGYVGIRLHDPDGAPIGHLAVLFRREIENTSIVMDVLRIFASRTAAELARWKTTRSLVQSEERYRTLTDATPDAVFLLDAEGRYHFVNRPGASMLGRAPEDLVGRTIFDVFPPPAAEGYLAAVRHVMATRRAQSDENLLVTAARPLWMDIRLIPVPNEEGKVTRVLGIARDITSRKQAEESRSKSETRYRKLFDLARDAIIVADAESGIILDANEEASRLTGRPREELVGLHQSRLHPDDLRESAVDHFRMHISDGGAAPTPHVVITSDGRRVPVEISARVIVQEDGRSVVQGLFRDMSEREREERQRDLHEKRMTFFLDLSSRFSEMSERELVRAALDEAVMLTGSEIGYFHFVEENENRIRLFTWTGNVMESCALAKEGEYALEEAGVWADCVRRRAPVVHNDYQGLPGRKGYPEGHTHVARHASVPVFDEGRIRMILGVGNKKEPYDDGDVAQLWLMATEIWSLICRRRAIEESRRLLRAVEQSTASIVITDRDGRIEYANPRAAETTGYSPAELLGQNPRVLKSGEMSPEEYRKLWETIASGADWKGEFHNRRKDGSLYWESAIISPIRDDRGMVTHYVAVKEDITERKRMEEERFAAIEKEAMLGRLAATVAHEVNNPLFAIKMQADSLARLLAGEEKKETKIRLIQEQVDRIGRTVRALLGLARRPSEGVGEVDLAELLRGVLLLYEVGFVSRNVAVTVHSDPDLPAITAHGDRLQQVFINILENARQAVGAGGRIDVSLRRTPERTVEILFEDTGPGFGDIDPEKVFEPKYTTKPTGTGLGLTITRRIIQEHGGTITAGNRRADEGGGARFRITLPGRA